MVFICSEGGEEMGMEGGMNQKEAYTGDQPHLIVSLPFFTAT